MITTVNFYRMRQLMRFEPRMKEKRADIISNAGVKAVQYSDMPRSPGYSHDKMDNAVIRLQEVEQAYKEIIDELNVQRAELVPYIDRLTDPHEKAVMRLRYINGHSPDKIAEEGMVPLCLSSVYNYLRRAEHAINAWQGWRQNG